MIFEHPSQIRTRSLYETQFPSRKPQPSGICRVRAVLTPAGSPQARSHPHGPAWVKTASEEGSGSKPLAGEAGGVSAV